MSEIIKANGERQEFSRAKLETSLRRAGTDKAVIRSIADHIERTIDHDSTTGDIYRRAFDLLSKSHRPAAHKYSLRRAVLELGPAGYPFEKYVAELFKARGWQAVTDQIVQGHCVEHEVDVVAWRGSDLAMVEAKFHNEPGTKSDLKVALYVKARWDDLLPMDFEFGGERRHMTESILVTNTKFTEKAIEYAECQKLRLIGWNYPTRGNLEDFINEVNLHPVTCLPNLSQNDKKTLMVNGIVLCKDVIARKRDLISLGIPALSAEHLADEAALICGDQAAILTS